MTKFIGDLHGNPGYKSLMSAHSIQLGDLDLRHYNHWAFDDCGPRFFIDGNHDHFPVLDPDSDRLQKVAPNLHYIPRGYVSGKVLFIGGAISVDRDGDLDRLNHDWYREEVLTQEQFGKIMDLENDIEVIVAHDCPQNAWSVEVAPDKYRKHGSDHYRIRIDRKTLVFREALLDIFRKFLPKLWIFGHHHRDLEFNLDGCKFRCVDVAKCVDYNIPLGEDLLPRP